VQLSLSATYGANTARQQGNHGMHMFAFAFNCSWTLSNQDMILVRSGIYRLISCVMLRGQSIAKKPNSARPKPTFVRRTQTCKSSPLRRAHYSSSSNVSNVIMTPLVTGFTLRVPRLRAQRIYVPVVALDLVVSMAPVVVLIVRPLRLKLLLLLGKRQILSTRCHMWAHSLHLLFLHVRWKCQTSVVRFVFIPPSSLPQSALMARPSWLLVWDLWRSLQRAALRELCVLRHS
jgi:hypothetical protein